MSKKAASSPSITRQQFSSGEIDKMLTGMDRILLTHKQEHEGIDPEDMVKTVRGRKVVWITQDEMNDILAKQRKLFGTRFPQHATQQENNLPPETDQKIDAYSTLIADIAKGKPAKKTGT